jgi:hypothetical protein
MSVAGPFQRAHGVYRVAGPSQDARPQAASGGSAAAPAASVGVNYRVAGPSQDAIRAPSGAAPRRQPQAWGSIITPVMHLT